jgi:oligosaccharide repeat unit polymerase
VFPLDYVHALCLVGIAIYIWQREAPRLLLVPLMLMSFFVLYGVGNIIYFIGADTVPGVRSAVTSCTILMWIGLVIGIEVARATSPSLTVRSELVTRRWKTTALSDRPESNQLLAVVGIFVALYILATFLYFGKPSQILNFVSLQSSADKAKYRHDFGAEGGYVYGTLVASVAPFLSFALLLKGFAAKRNYLIAIGLLVCAAVFAGKVGTFEKTPWLVYVLQLTVVYQAAKSLRFGIGRLLIFSVIMVAGVTLAVMIALPDLDSSGLVGWLVYRFFEANNEVVYETFYVYPNYLPHTWGMNVRLIHDVFGSGELLSAHSRVANFFGADGATFDSFFIGDAWVDFSYGGVLVMSLVVGFVVKTIDIFVTSLGKTPLCVALIGSGMYGLFQLAVTSAFTAFLSGGLVLIPLLAAASTGMVNDLSRGGRSTGGAVWPK